MFTPILATLGYVFDDRRERVLLVHRIARAGDAHLGKYNGLGGKLERDEDIVSGMKRELLEEAGIVATDLQLAGTISWPGFGKNGEDWFGFLFRIFAFEGTPSSANPEGTLGWHRINEVLELPLWDGDRYFLPRIFEFDSQPFHGVMPYAGGMALDWRFSDIQR